MKKLIILTACLLLSLLVSCSAVNKLKGGPPDSAEARKRFEKINEKALSDGSFKITDFEKTNGVLQSNGEQYTVTWKATVEYLKDVSVACCLQDSVYRAGGTIKTGEKREIDGTFIYFRTDNGWKMRDANGRFIEPY